MKNRFSLFAAFLLLLFSGICESQVSFNLPSLLCQGSSTTLTANTGTLISPNYTWTASPAGPAFSSPATSITSVSFPAAGSYTIKLSVSSGTTTIFTTRTITIEPFPIFALSPTTPTICPGIAATLIAGGASSYSWSPSAGIISPTSYSAIVAPFTSTVYTVTGVNPNCGSSSINFTVAVYFWPLLNITASAWAVCQGSTATLQGFGAPTLEWAGTTFSGTTQGPTISVAPGSYTLFGSYAGNCKTYLTAIVSSLVCTLIDENENEEMSFRIYPCPISNTLNLRSQNSGNFSLQIVDLLGNVLLFEPRVLLSGELVEINCLDIPPGIYFLRVFDENKCIRSYKLLKE